MKQFLRDTITVITIALLMVASYWIGANKDSFLPSGTDSVSQDAGSVLIFAHDAYLDGIEWIESKGDANAKGDLKNGVYRAIGSFQLWKIYVDDFNRIQLLNRAWHQAIYEDRWDPIASRKITAVVTSYYADHDWRDKPHTQLQWIETAVRAHKCSTDRNKESTKKYWLKVKARMEETF